MSAAVDLPAPAATPFAEVAHELRRNGWQPLPLPAGAKSPPPTGYTGEKGTPASGPDVESWCEPDARFRVGRGTATVGNVAVRLPAGVVGIDVDAHSGKVGGATLAALETAHGPLPQTVVSSRRFATDSVSGIRFYRVPTDARLTERPDVDVIQRHHRYAATAPSVVGGLTYQVLDERTGEMPPVLPPVDGLPDLPDAWLVALSKPAAEAAVTGTGAAAPAGPPSADLGDYAAEVAWTVRTLDVVARLAEGERGPDGERWEDAARVGAYIRLAELRAAGVDVAAALSGCAWPEPFRDFITMKCRRDVAPRPAPATVQALDVPGVTVMTATTVTDLGTAEPEVTRTADTVRPAVERRTLADVHAVYLRWFGDGFDLTALDAVLAAAAVDQLDGDTAWLLVVSGSGNAKTETVAALAGAGAHVTSTITSEGALLSATAKKEKAKDATGGLLRKIGDSGVLVVKDVTSVLSMGREMRGQVLAALREVYDGRWERNVGTDGGRTLTWQGRIVLIGAVTTAWDTAHAVIATMGDRFVLVRVDSGTASPRRANGRQALQNVGREVALRAELAEAVGSLLAAVDTAGAVLDDATNERLLLAADLVTLGRTAVEKDYQGNAVDAHAPEAPTRFAKQLAQLARGSLALGADPHRALAIAMRCARDSMPPLRLALLDDLDAHQESTVTDVRTRLQKPHNTVDRELQALHLLGLVRLDEYQEVTRKVWRYSLADGVEPRVLSC